MASEIIKIVDPDNGSGTDYTSLDAWEDALGGTTSGDLPTDDEIAVAKCRCTGGTADSAGVVISGWTTDATRYIKIWTDPTESYRHNGSYQTGNKYRMELTDADPVWLYQHTRFDGIQIQLTVTSGTHYAIRGLTGATVWRLSNSIIKCVQSGGTAHLVFEWTTANTLSAWNNILYGASTGSGFNVGGCYLYNNTIRGCGTGIQRDWGTVVAKNNVLCDNTDDFNGASITYDSNATDQGAGEGTNGLDISGTWDSTCFTDETTHDYSIESDSPLVGQGVDNPGSGLYSDDIVEESRTSTWDIGAFEYAAAGTALSAKRLPYNRYIRNLITR